MRDKIDSVASLKSVLSYECLTHRWYTVYILVYILILTANQLKIDKWTQRRSDGGQVFSDYGLSSTIWVWFTLPPVHRGLWIHTVITFTFQHTTWLRSNFYVTVTLIVQHTPRHILYTETPVRLNCTYMHFWHGWNVDRVHVEGSRLHVSHTKNTLNSIMFEGVVQVFWHGALWGSHIYIYKWPTGSLLGEPRSNSRQAELQYARECHKTNSHKGSSVTVLLCVCLHCLFFPLLSVSVYLYVSVTSDFPLHSVTSAGSACLPATPHLPCCSKSTIWFPVSSSPSLLVTQYTGFVKREVLACI